MKNGPQKIFRTGLLITLCLLLGFGYATPSPAAAHPSMLNTSPDLPGPQITLEDPTITPPYDGICNSAWYKFTNDRGHATYLTLNTNDKTESSNRGEWRPSLPQDGYYLVEAYIPGHPAITWECPDRNLKRIISWDTSDARYTVTHAIGEASISLNQAIVDNQWVSLGAYIFKAGTSGVVTLVDFNGESNVSKTVSFSAMRFTWVNAIPATIYLPLVTQNFQQSVTLNSVWTSDTNGGNKNAFTPGEAIRFNGSGSNYTSGAVSADFTWTQESPCGTKTVNSSVSSLPLGNWTHSFSTVATNCTGVYTFTVETNHQGQISTLKENFVVNNPSTVITSNRQAFDKCFAPPIDQMQTWWTNSPYFAINLYIGGIQRSCSNAALDAVWVAQASSQGWAFIPTWVGPQAPCSSYRYRMSSDPNVAYQQGIIEADAAIAAANRIGLERNKIIYYDLEGYTATTTCRNTVNSFIKGWVERLHALGSKAGVYGSPIRSYISDWATINPMPDDIWIASWVSSGYDPDASVWNINNLSNSLWANHQRIRQYAGDHRETWGGLSLTIDSNISDGDVISIPQTTPAATIALSNPVIRDRNPEIEAVQFVNMKQGWALSGQKLLWTDNLGASWKTITPSSIDDMQILDAFFLNAQQGWVVTRAVDTGRITIFHTTDGSQTWSKYLLAVIGFNGDFFGEVTNIDFVDTENGWIAMKLPSSSAFSLGSLFKTNDGGKTWEELSLPVGGKVHFIDSNRGWVAGGVSENDLYTTIDGGHNWKLQDIKSERIKEGDQVSATLPVFENGVRGTLPLLVTSSQTARVDLYRTQDGGESWGFIDQILLDSPVTGESVPLLLSDPWHLIIEHPKGNQLFDLGGEGKNNIVQTNLDLPRGVVELQFATPEVGWAKTQEGACSGSKSDPGTNGISSYTPFTCNSNSALYRTTDGGQSWIEITP